MKRLVISSIGVLVGLLMNSGIAAAGWDHLYTDPSLDVYNPDVDISRLRSYADSSDVVIELTVSGEIENSSEVTYYVHIGSETSTAGVFYNDGLGMIYYVDGGFTTAGIEVAGDTLRGRIPQSHAGSSSSFDVYGVAIFDVPGTSVGDMVDHAGPGSTGTTPPADQILGMAIWMLILVVLVPIVVFIVLIIVIVVLLAKKPPAAPQPPFQQPLMQQQPQQPPQRFPPMEPRQ